ncbi:O-methyltransferase, partial [Streptomyces sp. NPDC059168]|uniref:O-methyltransferase n=1 Tax=Streptomyces sp. NPDC059168 TaxID=3346753 RepID=UPI0036B96365
AGPAGGSPPGGRRTGRTVIDGWPPTGVRATADADGCVRPLVPEPPAGRPGPAAPGTGRLLYWLVRAMGPASVLGFGGALASGLAQLAAGARDNGCGRVTGCLPDARQAAAARTRLASAGLAGWAEVVHADVHTLGRAPAGAPVDIDLALLDCRPRLLLSALTALEPRMRPGTVVIAADESLTGAYLDRVRDGQGYLSVALPVGAGLQASLRLDRPSAGTRTTAPPGTAPVRAAPGGPLHPTPDH